MSWLPRLFYIGRLASNFSHFQPATHLLGRPRKLPGTRYSRSTSRLRFYWRKTARLIWRRHRGMCLSWGNISNVGLIHLLPCWASFPATRNMLFVSSIAGFTPLENLGPYSVSKTALFGLTKVCCMGTGKEPGRWRLNAHGVMLLSLLVWFRSWAKSWVPRVCE